MTNPYVREYSDARCDRASELQDHLHTMANRITAQMVRLPSGSERWETVGTGKQARRVVVRTPEYAALLRRRGAVQNRREAVLRIRDEIDSVLGYRERTGDSTWTPRHIRRPGAC